ncbi:MAG: diadenylate cyclase CdaA [Lentisphaeria bacterium]|nr:diadenylate cyclase CdaA [Lentisphaeria bacterium]
MGFITDISAMINQSWSILKPILDFSLIFLLMYVILYFLRGTRAVYILVGIVIFLIAAIILIQYMQLEVLGWLLQNLWPVLATAVVIVFQPELRRALALLGTTVSVYRKQEQSEAIEEVVKAVFQMARRYCGALIIFECKIGMAYIINSAEALDCKISAPLLQSLFYPNSPLHDGGVIIKDGKIVAAHAILPLAHDMPLNQTLGTRHRAGLGITEETDAVAVIVSEETGTVSVAYRGKLIRNPGEVDLLAFLRNRLVDSSQKSRLLDHFTEMQPEKAVFLQKQIEKNEGEK